MTIDRDNHFIAPNEALLIQADFGKLGVEGTTYTGPISKTDAIEMMNQDREYQALRFQMIGNKIDHTELPDEVTDELLTEKPDEDVPYVDPNAEHRLTGFDLGVGR